MGLGTVAFAALIGPSVEASFWLVIRLRFVMSLFARLFRLVWGGDVDRALRPVLAVSLAGSIAGASAYPVPRHLGDQAPARGADDSSRSPT